MAEDYSCTMEEKYNKVELLALIKSYNKKNTDKIKNIDKLKKEELVEVCKRYGLLLVVNDSNDILTIDLRNVNKKDLQRDVELFFMKQNKSVPPNIMQLRKKYLIDFMELNGVIHYTADIIEKEIKEIQKQNMLKNIIVYNIICYDNVDVEKIDNDKLDEFINVHKLDTNIEDFQTYCTLLHELYEAYEKFCTLANRPIAKDKLKSFPKIITNIQNIIHHKNGDFFQNHKFV